MKIRVTKQNISEGHGRDYHLCPVALAIRHKLEKEKIQYEEVTVGCKYAYIQIVGKRQKREIPLPPKVIEFIDRFDHFSMVRPLEFDLEL